MLRIEILTFYILINRHKKKAAFFYLLLYLLFAHIPNILINVIGAKNILIIMLKNTLINQIIIVLPPELIY